MSIHDGVVTVNDDSIPVILGLDDDSIRLSAGGEEIGEWLASECSIDPTDDGAFTITAEDEALRFVPNDLTGFNAAINGGRIVSPEPERVDEPDPEPSRRLAPIADGDDEPTAKPATKALFYALAAVTGALGLWALVNLIV